MAITHSQSVRDLQAYRGDGLLEISVHAHAVDQYCTAPSVSLIHGATSSGTTLHLTPDGARRTGLALIAAADALSDQEVAA